MEVISPWPVCAPGLVWTTSLMGKAGRGALLRQPSIRLSLPELPDEPHFWAVSGGGRGSRIGVSEADLRAARGGQFAWG